MKTIKMFGLLSLLLLAAYLKVAGNPSEAAQGADRPVTLTAPAVMGNGGKLPARLSEYVFLHQARDESIPVHAMAGVMICPE